MSINGPGGINERFPSHVLLNVRFPKGSYTEKSVSGAGYISRVYFGARYYDAGLSLWISADPAFEKYLPTASQLFFPEDKFDFRSLPGIGGVYNSVNLNVYHYAGQNPVKLVDPDGNKVTRSTQHLLGKSLEKASSKILGKLLGAIGRIAGPLSIVFTPTRMGDDDQKTYQTYTKRNPKTGKIYSGMTSGYGSPEENVMARDINHHMNEKGFGKAKLDKTSRSKAAIRGREQMLIDFHGGAQSEGGTSGNPNRGIDRKNPNLKAYIRAALLRFGFLKNNNPKDQK